MAQLFGSLLIFLSCHPSSNAAQMLEKMKNTTGVNGIEKGKGIEKGGVLEWRVL